MNPEPIFTYENDGVQMIGHTDKLAIKKNGLTIELTWEQVSHMAQIFQDMAGKMQAEHQDFINRLFGGQA